MGDPNESMSLLFNGTAMGIEFPANGLSKVVDGAMVSLSISVQISDGLHSVELSLTKK